MDFHDIKAQKRLVEDGLDYALCMLFWYWPLFLRRFKVLRLWVGIARRATKLHSTSQWELYILEQVGLR